LNLPEIDAIVIGANIYKGGARIVDGKNLCCGIIQKFKGKQL
jgi:hypothetical protein